MATSDTFPFDINARRFICPKAGCGRRLTLKFSTASTRFFINCFNDAHPRPFSHYFQAGVVPASTSVKAATPSAPIHPPQNSVHTTAQAPTSQRTCAIDVCLSLRVAKLCARAMCKSHCESRGGCMLHPLPPPPLLLPSLSSASMEVLNHIQEFTPVPRWAEQTQRDLKAREQHHRREEDDFLALLASPPLSQEEKDLQLALLLPSPPPPPSRLRSPTASSSRSRARSSLASSSRHQTSAVSSYSRSPLLCFSPSPPPPSMITDTLAQARRRSFILIDCQQDNKPANVSGIQDVPNWPYWRRSGTEHYQCYDKDLFTWITVGPSYVHNVTSGTLLVRTLNVRASDEQQHILRVAPLAPPSRVPDSVIEISSDEEDVVVVVSDYRPLERAKRRRIKVEPVTPAKSSGTKRRLPTLSPSPRARSHSSSPSVFPSRLLASPFRASH
ncbi:hypothetical protein C8R47DRAFT_1085966 [Mycena vitilis]|nr:hypothetical protein C8R47DRAFT_1085966 [Mycena vitilis]